MGGNKLTAVQGYRFFLFLSVYLFHCATDWFSIGWGGVEAFLVLSSFFLTKKLYSKEEIHFGKELTHRLKRLYPAYIFVIAGASLVYMLYARELPYDVPAFLLSAQNFFWVLFGWNTPLSGILGHTWYITLDVYLFMLWVLVLKTVPKVKWTFVSYIGVLFAYVWRICSNIIFEDRTISYTIPFGLMDSYCMGSLLALNIINGKKDKKYSLLDVSIGVLGILLCFAIVGYKKDLSILESYQFFGNAANYTGNPILVNIYFFVGLLSVGLLRICLNASSNSLLSKSWIVTLGNWSYELYLFHYPIICCLGRFMENKWLLIVTALLITTLAVYLWHKFIEKRIVKLIGK